MNANLTLREKQLLQYQEKGFLPIRKNLNQEDISYIRETVMSNIEKCIKETGLSKKDYLASTSRWMSPSPIFDGVETTIRKLITPLMELLFGEECICTRFNIIYKCYYSTGEIPFHQDISFSPNDPYMCSSWLPLNHVSLESGAMEFIEGSHKGKIHPPVDLWNPNFQDKIRLSNLYKNAIAVPTSIGDMILFDSKIWHGSLPNKNRSDRLALVCRWKPRSY